MWGPMGFDGDLSNLPAICGETVERGYAGIETNPLFWRDNTRMLFGDAKKSMDGLVTALRT